MKKVVLLLCVILLTSALVLIGCTGTTPVPSQSPQPGQSSQAPQTTAPPTTSQSAVSPESPQSSASPARTETINLKFSHHQPPQSYFGGADAAWAQAINEASNGRVKITVYPGGTLVKQQDEYDAVLSGLTDIGLVIPDVTPGRFDLSGLDTLPMLFPSGKVLGSVYWDILQKYYMQTDFSKVKVLWIQAMTPAQTISRKPIQNMSDFQGLKWRVEGKIESWTMTALGASPSLIDLSEAYTALDKGVVDGINFVWEGVLAFGFQQITKYRVESNLMCRGFVIMMNLDKWNSLPPDVQALFEKFGGKEYSSAAGAAGDQAMNGPKQALIEYDKKVGNPPITTLSPEERAKWTAACQTVWNQWTQEKDSAGLPGSAILADTQELVKQYSQ